MPKKGTRKIFSQRKLQQRLSSRQRERSRTGAREAKEAQRFINANNTTHTVPFQTVKIETEPKETVIDEENDFETVDLPNTSPTEVQILGIPKRGKYLRKNTRRLSNKQKQRLNFKQTRKQRQQAVQQARQTKQQERQMENAEENNQQNYVELDYYNNDNYDAHDPVEQMRRYQQEQMELERLEQEYEREQVRKAQKEYNKAEKNKFYFRSNDNKLKKIHVLSSFFKYISQYRIHKLEFAYLDQDFNKSYCYLLKLEEDSYYSNNNNNYFDNNWPRGRRYGYRQSTSYHTEDYDVYKKNPINLFRPASSYMSLNYYLSEDELDTMGSVFDRRIEKSDLRKFLRRLPFVKEKLAKEEAAKYTVPVKLKDLQMKATDAAVQQFEQKTGRYVPREAQNIIEQMIKPIDYRYYQGRDNLQRIKTDLFQTQANNGKERLRKINTGLFQE